MKNNKFERLKFFSSNNTYKIKLEDFIILYRNSKYKKIKIGFILQKKYIKKSCIRNKIKRFFRSILFQYKKIGFFNILIIYIRKKNISHINEYDKIKILKNNIDNIFKQFFLKLKVK